MASRWIKVDAGDGKSFDAYLSLPPSGRGPGLVVVQEIFGVNASIRDAADMFAAEGMVALAPDLFWRLEPRIELAFDDESSKRAFELHKQFNYDQGMRDMGAAVAALRALAECTGPVGATGFCLGGTFAYLAATRLGVDFAAAYYGTRIHQYLGEAGKVQCPLLLHFGEADHTTPPEVIAAVRGALAANPRVQIHLYPGAKHAFANTHRASHDPAATALAHRRTLEFFRAAVAARG
jgi:carboxymethylenebutenolidase